MNQAGRDGAAGKMESRVDWNNLPYISSQVGDENPAASSASLEDPNPTSYATQGVQLVGRLLDFAVQRDQQQYNAQLAQGGANVRGLSGVTPAPGAGLSIGKLLLVAALAVGGFLAVKKLAR